MDPVRPSFLPDPEMARDAMEEMQRDIAATAVFEDEHGIDPEAIALSEPLSLDWNDQSTNTSAPIVAGIDQAFLDEEAVSAVVAVQEGQVIEVACGRTALEIPYIPGLLAFREGGPIVEALRSLSVEPALLLLDGSGRIHFRQAGIATHIGVIFDVPAIGVAKRLLCGTPDIALEDPLLEGERVPIAADEDVSASAGTVIGYAFQSRQFPDPAERHVNPLYLSPGNRVSEVGAVDLVEALCSGYKLPEPIRLADRAAEECKD
ncbi:MAG: endonuclease V [Halodesulfurarchaeum sp.]